ncbi:MAG: ATP-binding cassette domain-containing protein, partial [Spirochaeta sp.]|nr:ATP-binding cassette domain-containing protein [Spirochaeta sp.]
MTTQHAEQHILSLQGLSKIYPGTVALQDVSLEVRRGETHGIIGKNGAGKTTLVGIVAGLVQPTAGVIRINGSEYTDLSRIVAKKERVAIVPQEPQMVRDCSVAENLFMPDFPTRGGGLFMDRTKLYTLAEQIVAKGRLNIDVRAKAGDLGIGMQQILLMLKASYVEQAQIIILDEAFSSLSKNEETLFFEIMRDKKAEGCTILHISHRIDELLEVCDRMTVLRDGRAVATVRRDEVHKEKLSALIVGPVKLAVAGGADEADAARETTRSTPVRAVAPATAARTKPAVTPDAAPTPAPADGVPVLSVRGLSAAESYIDISFDVHRNEILGIAGLMGSGRTEILKSVYGMYPIDSGQIQLHGKTLRFSGPAEALRHKVAYLPED